MRINVEALFGDISLEYLVFILFLEWYIFIQNLTLYKLIYILLNFNDIMKTTFFLFPLLILLVAVIFIRMGIDSE